MSDLFLRVLHHLEGKESVTHNWQTADSIKAIERISFGADRWIERVHERRIMTALDCIALIFFALDDWSASPSQEQEKRLVDGWAAELRRAAENGEIKARDPFTLLALETVPDGWEWSLSMAEADNFLASRGMEWKLGEIAEHLYNESKANIDKLRFPPELFTANSNTPKSPLAASAEQTGDDWITKARAIAIEYIARHKAQDLFPTQDDVCKHLETELRENKIFGGHERPLSASYIKRNAIQGEWWRKNKP